MEDLVDILNAIKHINFLNISNILKFNLLRINVSIEKIEKFFSNRLFRQYPNSLIYILSLIITLIISLIYWIISIILPHSVVNNMYISFITISIFYSMTLSFIKIKKFYFNSLKDNHFFNLIGDKQSDFIIYKANSIIDNIFYLFYLPISIPGVIHLVITTKNIHFVMLFLLFTIGLFQLYKVVIVIYWFIYNLLNNYSVVKVLYDIFHALFIMFSMFFWLFLFINDNINFEANFLKEQLYYFYIGLALIDVILYFLGFLSKLIIRYNYKKLIYYEGNTKKKRQFKLFYFLLKFMCLGKIGLTKEEKSIYKKEALHLLRKKHGVFYYIFIELMLIFFAFDLSLIQVLDKSKAVSYFNMFFFSNILLIFCFGGFLLLNNNVTTFKLEIDGLLKKLKVNDYTIFKVKKRFHIFHFFIPLLIYNFVLTFQIQNSNNFLAYLFLLIYNLGVIEIFITSEMLNDYHNKWNVKKDFVSVLVNNYTIFIFLLSFGYTILYFKFVDEFGFLTFKISLIIIIIIISIMKKIQCLKIKKRC